MNQTVLVTGAAGFAGQYMCQYIRAVRPDIKIVGIDVRLSSDPSCNDFSVLDLTDAFRVREVMAQTRPAFVLHFAGTFGTGTVQDCYRMNVLSMVSILEVMREIVPSSVFIGLGSAAEYGKVPTNSLPIVEDVPCSPVTPYGLSKYMATQVAVYYYRIHGLCTMIARPFQLIGKGITDRLAPGAFAGRLLQAQKSGDKTIAVGNLESSRDFLDIHDAVRAIWCLCEKPAPGEIFNLCSGSSIKMSELLNLMIQVNHLDVHPVIDSSCLKGKTDVNVVYGSFQKIKDHCGWEPKISLQQSVTAMFK